MKKKSIPVGGISWTASSVVQFANVHDFVSTYMADPLIYSNVHPDKKMAMLKLVYSMACPSAKQEPIQVTVSVQEPEPVEVDEGVKKNETENVNEGA